MSTRNFMSVNPSAVYALEVSEEADDIETQVKDTQDYIIESLKGLKTDTRDVDAISDDNTNGYGGWCFGMVYGTEGRDNAYALVTLIQRSGYYSGVNFDYTISYMVEGEECEDEDLESACIWGKEDYKDISKSEVKRLRSNARAMQKKVDKVLADCTTSLRVAGTFSNGEAVYERN